MPTQMEMAKLWVGAALKRCKETGEPQQSKDWGYGDRKRVVTIGAYDASTGLYTVHLLCWGFPEKTITDKWASVFIEASDVLANAG